MKYFADKSLYFVLGGVALFIFISHKNEYCSVLFSLYLIVAFCQIVSLCSRLALWVGCQNQFRFIANSLTFYFGQIISACIYKVSQEQKNVHPAVGERAGICTVFPGCDNFPELRATKGYFT